MSHLDELQAGRITRDEAFVAAEKLEGVEKAQALAKGLSGLNEDLVIAHYKEVIDQISALDPEDASGYGGKMKFKAAMNGLRSEVMASMQAGEMDGIPAKVDAFITEYKLEGEQKQAILGYKMDPLMRSGKFDEAGLVLDAIIAADPESADGKRAAGFKPKLDEMKAAAEAAETGDAPDAAPPRPGRRVSPSPLRRKFTFSPPRTPPASGAFFCPPIARGQGSGRIFSGDRRPPRHIPHPRIDFPPLCALFQKILRKFHHARFEKGNRRGSAEPEIPFFVPLQATLSGGCVCTIEPTQVAPTSII